MLCTVGDLLTDIIVRPSGSTRPATDTPSVIVHRRGGSAANVAVVAAGEVEVRFVGQVGDDRRGDDLINELRGSGVDPVIVRGGATGTVVALVDESGERSFLTDRGAATQLAFVDPAVLDDVSWLHVPGYSFARGPLADVCHRLVGEAVERDIPVSVSTASTSALGEFGRYEFLELLRAIRPRAVIANRAEAYYLVADEHRFPGAEISIVTDGARPTRLTTADSTVLIDVAEADSVVDTTGAGDAFTGAFIAAMMQGGDAPAAVRAGHVAAARGLAMLGALSPGEPE